MFLMTKRIISNATRNHLCTNVRAFPKPESKLAHDNVLYGFCMSIIRHENVLVNYSLDNWLCTFTRQVRGIAHIMYWIGV